MKCGPPTWGPHRSNVATERGNMCEKVDIIITVNLRSIHGVDADDMYKVEEEGKDAERREETRTEGNNRSVVLHLSANVPLPASFVAAVDAVKALGRDTARASGIENNLLAFVDIGGADSGNTTILSPSVTEIVHRGWLVPRCRRPCSQEHSAWPHQK